MNLLELLEGRLHLLAIGMLIILVIIYKALSKEPSALALAKNGEFEAPLLEKKVVSHDTYIFVFGLPNNELTLGVPVGQHIVLKANVPIKDGDTEEVERKYTPISKINQKINDKIIIGGPKGRLTYLGRGNFLIKGRKPVQCHFDSIGMVAGGTGITPMFQLIRAIHDDPNDKTTLNLLFANKSEAGSNWPHFKGFITKEMLEKCMPQAGPNAAIFSCGPLPMTKLVTGLSVEMGHNEDLNTFKF